MPVDINYLRGLYEGGEEADMAENRPEDSTVTILGALPELLDELEALRARAFPKSLLDTLKKLHSQATPGPWIQNYGYNNGGCPTAFFDIPGHNLGANVEMLVSDAVLIVELRNLLPALISYLEKT